VPENIMNLQPLTDHILVKPLKKEEKSSIVLPESEKDKKSERGEVVAIGPGRILDNGQKMEMNVKIGDKILFRQYAPDEIDEDGEKFLLMSESDVLAIIK
jgi:chaperonin GroES